MKQSPEQLVLQHSMTLCQGHAEALQEALQDIQLRAMGLDDYTHLNKEDRRLLDQLASTKPGAMCIFLRAHPVGDGRGTRPQMHIKGNRPQGWAPPKAIACRAGDKKHVMQRTKPAYNN
jgi:hypothetical protein